MEYDIAEGYDYSLELLWESSIDSQMHGHWGKNGYTGVSITLVLIHIRV